MRMWIAAAAVSLLLSSGASALPGISLSQPPPRVGADQCPPLIQIKYPWLGCKTNAEGRRSFTTSTVAPNASWGADRRIPFGHRFVECAGNWKTHLDIDCDSHWRSRGPSHW